MRIVAEYTISLGAVTIDTSLLVGTSRAIFLRYKTQDVCDLGFVLSRSPKLAQFQK